MQDQVKGYMKAVESDNKAMTDDLAKRIASTADIQGALHKLLSADSANTAKLLDLRFRMTGVLNASQWGEVFPAPAPK